MMVHAAMLKRTYDWCIDAADKPYALWILAAVAFAESSFFPIPPDIMLLPMSLARPKKAWWFATVCTIASVAGGVLGYAIGALLYDSIGQWLITLYGLSDKVETFRASYAEWGAVIILLKGLTPIPYKLVTITSGFAGYNIWLFVLCSIVARGGRFFIVAVLLNRYGDPIRSELEKRLGLWVAIGAVVLVLGFVHRVQADLDRVHADLALCRHPGFRLRSCHAQIIRDATCDRGPRCIHAGDRSRSRLAAGRASTHARPAVAGPATGCRLSPSRSRSSRRKRRATRIRA